MRAVVWDEVAARDARRRNIEVAVWCVAGSRGAYVGKTQKAVGMVA